MIGLVSSKDDPDVAAVRRFARRHNINFPIVWENDDFGESLARLVNADDLSQIKLGVRPQTFIIDKGGRIRKLFRGYDPSKTPGQFRKALDEVVKDDELRP